MADDPQLAWEKQAAPYAAAAAFGAVALQVAYFVPVAAVSKNTPGSGDPLALQRGLVDFHQHSGALLASTLAQAFANLFAAGALYYLFRATRHRRKELPQIVQWLLVIGPVLVLIAAVLNWTGFKSAADKYTSAGAAADVRAKPTKKQHDEAVKFCKQRGEPRQSCVPDREKREAVADKLVKDNRSPVAIAATLGGQLALAFSFVVVALNAMRAGLLSRFVGILGVIVGALVVLPLVPLPIVQIFWLGALGLLFLDRWPGGRGPAWETGEATPWPVPEGRAGGGGLFGPRPQRQEAEPEPEPEPVERPASRKRKRKRR